MSDAISLATPDPRWAESYVVGRDEVLNLLPTPPLDVQRHVLFRDRLRADAVIWREYEALKLDRALGHADDREAYAKGKDGFIDSVGRPQALNE